MTCLWIGCDQAPSRRGICSRHYQRTLAAGMKASKPIPVSVPERLDELAHLLWGGEWPTRAAQRCGWTLSGAESAAREHGRHDILSSLRWERSYVEGASAWTR